MNEDLSSDASDEDYVPEGPDVVLPSEEESDDAVEDDLVPQESRKRGKTKTKKTTKRRKKIKTADIEPKEDESNEEPAEVKPLTVEEEKKKVDSLWADFLKDTDTKPKSTETSKAEAKATPTPSKITKKPDSKPTEEKKVTITKIFEFAGEEVKVTKEVPVNSVEAKISTGAGGIATRGRSTASRGRGGGGLSSILSQLGKKEKISTLEKSKLDWDMFKKDENIEEELQAHNKGKNGYLERQDFLERADLRQFEIEKDIRATHRSNRL